MSFIFSICQKFNSLCNFYIEYFFFFSKMKKWGGKPPPELLIELVKKLTLLAEANYDHLIYCPKRVKKLSNNYSFYLKKVETSWNGTGEMFRLNSEIILHRTETLDFPLPGTEPAPAWSQDLGTSVVVVAVHICIRWHPATVNFGGIWLQIDSSVIRDCCGL